MQEEFLNNLEEILGKDYNRYLDSLQEIPRKAIHINTSILKDKSILKSILKEQIPYDETSYFIDLEKPGLSIFHTLGLFYVQEPSAMMPVLAKEIPKDANVLDLCASPGGKTLQLANIVTEGVVFANEMNKARCKKLVSNVERLGLTNVIVTQMTSQELKKTFLNYFDFILVDAPCSLEGTFRKDPLAISLWSKERVLEMAKLQKEIVKDAVSMLKKDGILIYSTCTFSKEEDEEVVKEILDTTNMQLLSVNDKLIPYTKEGCDELGEALKKTRRCYPFLIGEGQYLAVLKKSDGTEETIPNNLGPLSSSEYKIIMEALQDTLTEIPFSIFKYHNQIIAVPKENIEVPDLKTASCFVKIGEMQKGRCIFHHQFARSYGIYFKRQVDLTEKDSDLDKYLSGLELERNVEDGWGVITVEGYPLGLFKASQNKLKNHYPKGLRT